MHERIPVLDVSDQRQALPDGCHRRIRVSMPHRKDRTNIETKQAEPGTSVAKRRCGLDDHPLCLVLVVSGERYPSDHTQRVAHAPRTRQRLERPQALGIPFTRRADVAGKPFDVPAHQISDRHDVRCAGVRC